MSNAKQHLEYQSLKSNLVSELKERDLVGKVIYSRDLMSDFMGGVLDSDIGGINTKLVIEEHDGSEITVSDDFDDQTQIDLRDLGLEVLISLLD